MSQDHWQRTMQGHSAANLCPVIASNRIGKETASTIESAITFYGSSFITDNTGEMVAVADKTSENILTHTFDLDKLKFQRYSWGLFRDRRPTLYGRIASLDGTEK